MKRHLVLVSIALLGIAPGLMADGGSVRSATPAEQQYTVRVMKAMQRALPKPPAGFEVAEETAVEPPETVDEGCENQPMSAAYGVTWLNQELADKEQREEDALIEKLAAQMKADQGSARMERLAARQEDLGNQLAAALEKNDMARVKKIQSEMETLGKEAEKIGSGQEAAINSAHRKLAKRSRLEIRLEANTYSRREILRSEHTQEKPCAGLPVHRCHDAEGGHPDTLEVYLGPWKQTATESHVTLEHTPVQAPHTRVQNMRVVVRGNPEDGRKTLERVDWPALKALMK